MSYRIENQHLAQEMHRFVVGLRGEIVEGAERRGFAWSSLHMDSSALTGITSVFQLGSAQEVSNKFQLLSKRLVSIMTRIAGIPVEWVSEPGIEFFCPGVRQKCNRRTKYQWLMCNVERPSIVQELCNTVLQLLESSILRHRFHRLGLNQNHRSAQQRGERWS